MAAERHLFRASSSRGRGAFTLIEIMVVIAISALLLSTAIPSLYRRLDKDSMQKAVADILEACSHARAHAILQGTTTHLKIRPIDRSFQVGTSSVASSSDSPEGGVQNDPSAGGGSSFAAPASGAGGVFNFTLSSAIQVEGLGVNGEDWTEDEEVLVRFFPNGTSDEMSIVLRSDKGEQRNIWLEVVTALAEVETEVAKFRAR
jgi:prepilin-type N-terminal cleavage/methylation domain-containing protein